MIYAVSSKIIFNEGRQAREEPSILKLPVNISTDRCRTRRCGLRGGAAIEQTCVWSPSKQHCQNTGTPRI